MATERITRYVRLVIDASGSQSGSREVRRALEDINASVKRTVSGLDGLKTAFAAVFAAVGVRELARMADGWNLVAGRLNILEGSTVAAAAAQAELLRVANSARAEFEGVATLYTRIGSVTRELGLSQRDNALATEALALSFRVAGATAAEASSSSIQFTQSLASGVVRGEELNSLLDSNIPLVKIIAREFGVTTGELKRLGEEGLLSTSRILPALIRELDNLRDQASKLPETIGGAFTVLGNNLQAFVGQVDAATGITDFFARAIILLADNLDTAAVFFGTLSTIAIPGVIAGIRTLTALLAANPIGLIAIAGAAAAAALFDLSKQTVQFGDTTTTMGRVVSVVFGDFMGVLGDVGAFASAVFFDFTNWLQKLAEDSGITWADVASGARFATNGIIAAFKSAIDFLSAFIAGSRALFIDFFGGIIEAAGSVPRAVMMALQGDGEGARQLFIDAFDFDRVAEVAGAAGAKIAENFSRDFIAEAGAVLEPYVSSVLERAAVSRRIPPAGGGAAVPGFGSVDEPGDGADGGARKARDRAKKLRLEIVDTTKEAENFGEVMQRSFENIGGQAVDRLIEGLQKGKLAIGDFVSFAIIEFSRAALRQSISSIVTPLLGLATNAAYTAGFGAIFNATPAPLGVGAGQLGFEPRLPARRIGGANGGDFMVPGGSGIDSRMLFVSPGERVSVRKAGDAGDRAAVVQNITIQAADAPSAIRARHQIARAYKQAASAGGRYS